MKELFVRFMDYLGLSDCEDARYYEPVDASELTWEERVDAARALLASDPIADRAYRAAFPQSYARDIRGWQVLDGDGAA